MCVSMIYKEAYDPNSIIELKVYLDQFYEGIVSFMLSIFILQPNQRIINPGK